MMVRYLPPKGGSIRLTDQTGCVSVEVKALGSEAHEPTSIFRMRLDPPSYTFSSNGKCERPVGTFGDPIYKRLMDDGDDTRDVMLRAIGDRIRNLREAKKLAPKEFAAAAGFSLAYLWRVEGGQQNLRVTTISKIAIALDVPMSALFENIEADPSTVGTGPYTYRSGISDQPKVR